MGLLFLKGGIRAPRDEIKIGGINLILYSFCGEGMETEVNKGAQNVAILLVKERVTAIKTRGLSMFKAKGRSFNFSHGLERSLGVGDLHC